MAQQKQKITICPDYDFYLLDADNVATGKVCPYCGRRTSLADSAEVYHGRSYGMMYICRPCGVYVGCH